MKTVKDPTASDELAQLLKGVYERVSRELGLSPSYVGRAARGELRSKIVESALERELRKVSARVNRGKSASARSGTGKNGRKRGASQRSLGEPKD